MFNFKKNKKKNVKTNSPTVKIVIKGLLANNVPNVLAEFRAEQSKDNNTNWVLINEAQEFKHELEVNRLKIIDDLKFKLDILSMPPIQQMKNIDSAIVKQQQFIKLISNDFLLKDDKSGEFQTEKVEDNGKQTDKRIRVNLIDEKAKLEHLKILKEDLQKDRKGSYQIFNIDNERQIEFFQRGSDYIPIFHGAITGNTQPDSATSNKIYVEGQIKIDQDFIDENTNPLSGLWGKIMFGIYLIFFISTIIFNAQLHERDANISATILEETSQCRGELLLCTNDMAKYTRTVLQDNADTIDFARQMITNNYTSNYIEQTDEQSEKAKQNDKDYLSMVQGLITVD